MGFLDTINLHFRSTAELEIKGFSDIFLMYGKEQKIFKQTRNYLNDKVANNPLVKDYQYDLYDFQILIEFLERHAKKIGIDPTQKELLLIGLNALSLANRFLVVGHYNIVGKYLRNFMESTIDAVHLYLGNKSCLNKRKDKIVEIQEKAAALDHYNYQEDWVGNKKFAAETYKLYEYLCKYVHSSSLIEKIEYSEKILEKHILLISITLYFVSRILLIGFSTELPLYWNNKIRKKVIGEKGLYQSLILNLLNDTGFYNTIKQKNLTKYHLTDLPIEAKNIFPDYYFN